jgi:hypothetical protein
MTDEVARLVRDPEVGEPTTLPRANGPDGIASIGKPVPPYGAGIVARH